MALFPFERYQLISPLTAAQIAEKIKAADDDLNEYSTKLTGNIIRLETAKRFKIGGYSQSFKPDAHISIKTIQQGSALSVVIKPKTWPIIILVLIVVVFMMGIWYSQRVNIAVGHYKDAIIASAGLLILAYLLPVTALNAELPKLKIFINDLLEVAKTS
jgi:hypothetical protein